MDYFNSLFDTLRASWEALLAYPGSIFWTP